jgi:type I restriction enzyme S subunit
VKTNWRATQLGEIAEIVSGGTPRTSVAEYWDGGVPWATPKDLSSLDGAVIHNTPRTISSEGLRSCGASLLPIHSVLLSSRAPIGHVAINAVPMATNQGFKSLVPDPRVLDSKFLYWWLRWKRPALESMGNGATFKEISKKTTASIEIELPPMDEQRRIAEMLDAADTLRVKRQQALAKLDALPQAIFLDRFVVTESDEWAAVRVESVTSDKVGSIRTGPFGSQLLHSEFVDDGVAVLGIDNAVQNRFVWDERRFITEEKFSQLRRYRVFPGDVLVTIMGTCGRVAIVPDDVPCAINTKHLCCITPKKERCLPEFLWGCLRFHPRVLRQLGATHGAVMPGLNMGRIKEAEIPLPPIEEQRLFAEEFRAAETTAESLARSLGELDTLCAALQQRAFRGEL